MLLIGIIIRVRISFMKSRFNLNRTLNINKGKIIINSTIKWSHIINMKKNKIKYLKRLCPSNCFLVVIHHFIYLLI